MLTCRFRLLTFIGICLVALLCVTNLAAQTEKASVRGTVTDPSGAIVPAATVRLVDVDHGTRAQATTNSDGIYSFPEIAPGNYRMEVEKGGFKIIHLTGITANVQDNLEENFKLDFGTVSESITVEARRENINTIDGSVSTVVDSQFVENLPLNGRSFQSLIDLTPGITVVAGGGPNVNGQFSVNGQRQTANAFYVDGVSANFAAQPGSVGTNNEVGNLPAYTILGTTQALVSVDALQEFKIESSTYSAEFGRQPGGQVSLVTRSGTNSYHGSVFEYFRNEDMNANDWFADKAHSAKPRDRENDFGGVFGGPIVIPHIYNGKNRTFFFFSYEGLRLAAPAFSLSNVPSMCLRGLGGCAPGEVPAAAALQPVLQAWPVPTGKNLLCPAGATILTCGVCPGGVAIGTATCPSGTSPANIPVLSTAGTPNGLAEFPLSYSLPTQFNATSVRIDHSFGAKLNVFGRYSTTPSQSITQSSANLGRSTRTYLETETLTLGATWTISPSMTNDLRANYSNNPAFNATLATDLNGAITPPRSSLVLPQYDTPGVQSVIALFTIPGNTGGTQNLTLTDNTQATQRQYNVVDSLSWTEGKHQFKFGVDYRKLTPVDFVNTNILTVNFGLCPSPANGCFANTRQQLTNAVAGTGSVGATLKVRPIVHNYSLFAEDTWKVTHRLTLSLGLRWDVNPAPGEANGNVPLAVDQITNLATMNLAPFGTPEYKTYYKGFAPRTGLAYQLIQTPGHETVIRGGFGVFYDSGNDNAALNFNGRIPMSSSHTISQIAYPLSAATVAPGTVPVVVPAICNCSIIAFDPNLKLPATLEWNVAIEEGLGKSQTLKVTYVGASGTNLLSNNFDTLTGPASAGKIFNPNFTNVTLWKNGATSNYNALQSQFTRRLSHNFQALVSYTWSHALTNDPTNNAGPGNAGFDIRHSLGAAITYDIPAPGKNRLVDQILGHWSIDSSIRAQSALPTSVISSQGVSPVDGSPILLRAFQNPGVPLYLTGDACTASNGGLICPGGRRLNPAAFTALTTLQIQSLTQGTSGLNKYRALGAWQVDQAVRREFKITERVKFQLRAEAFNIMNHPNFGPINGSLASATFGEPTTMLNKANGVGAAQVYLLGGPRAAQIAGKIIF